MADIIEYADWSVMQTMINEGSAAVSGMTAAEAEAAMGAVANSGLYTYQAASAAGSANVIDFPNAVSAADAFADYVTNNGTTSAAGAATAATGAVTKVANMVLTKVGSAASGVAGLLSVSLPTAVAAIAPLAGVAIGAGLYESNPQLWERISRTLLPFCYDDGETVPVTVDANGNTYFAQELIDAFKQFCIDEGIGDSSIVPVDPSIGTYTITAVTPPLAVLTEFMANASADALNIISINSSNIEALLAAHPDYNCLEVWYSSPLLRFFLYKVTLPYTATVSMSGNLKRAEIRNCPEISTWFKTNPEQYDQTFTTGTATICNGNPVSPGNKYVSNFGEQTSGTFPEGTSRWEGDPYPSGATPIEILTGYDPQGNPEYVPYYPVGIPTGDPGVTTDPEDNPDPTINVDVGESVNPWINPVPNPDQYPYPWPWPYPEPAPLPNPVPIPQEQNVPDPDEDASQDPDPDEVPDDPIDPVGPTDEGDGDPPIIPVVPTVQTGASGLLHVYNPTQTQIDSFGAWLWQTWSDTSIWETIQKLFNDPMDGVIGLHELYATPAVVGSGTIKCGYLDSQVSAALVGNRYTSINCGSIIVEEYYQNYLDYSPYTQCYIYLPFIGIVPVSADDIIGNAVSISYHIDSYTGCCIAVVTVARNGYSSTVYQFEGNCAVEIPITSGYQSALMSGLLAVAGTVVGGPSVGMTAAHVGRAGLGKNTVQHSGSFGSSYGAMGAKVPYIIVRRPVQKKVTNYSKSYGYPAHKMVYVGNCQGYLRAKEVRVMSTTATNIEKEMIVTALKEGVYVK